jgi:hypothetical protein
MVRIVVFKTKDVGSNPSFPDIIMIFLFCNICK